MNISARHSPMCNCTSVMRRLAQAGNPYSRSWSWIPGSRFARPGMTLLFLLRHFLRGLSEHVPAGLFVERLLHEFPDRKTRLHLRARADLGVPALDVRIIVERKALGFVGHGPGKAGDVGDRIVAGDVSPGFSELPIEHAIKPRGLVAIAFD